MNRLHNLPIRIKFALAFMPLLLIIVISDYIQIKEHYFDYEDANRLNEAVLVEITINHAVHEIQKERGITSGLLAYQSDDFLKVLKEQRAQTDNMVKEFRDQIKKESMKDIVDLHRFDLEMLTSYLERIPGLRQKIDSKRITPNQSITYFSEINEVALKTVNTLIKEARDRRATEQVHAIIYFLKAKERASIERAIGTQAFSDGAMNNELHGEFSALVSAQKSYLDAYRTIADEESVIYYDKTVSGQDVVEVDRLRSTLLNNEGLDEDPVYWHDVITAKIDLLKNTEDFMSDKLHDYTEEISQSAYSSLLTVLVADVIIALITFFLVAFIITHLLKNIETLKTFTQKIIGGDMNQSVEIETKDEIGSYAKTFNLMIEQINKAQYELRRQKTQAQYLYENIYKQSRVVFENVGQGIFLLNKEHKISKLYSRAMEVIFQTKKIAEKTLVDFMESLLIPRDLEALEMFMKHLFNPEIDEDVVNQLNPVEQIKIFTESGGIIETKYVRLEFTRIEDKRGGIQQIMVTVSDETESVLLQQQVEEADEKRKIEIEQMLSILKIDPALLRGFIFNAHKELKSISEKYENHEGNDYRELLTFTFNIVHNLKGNTIVVGLQILTDRFHKIEDLITRLEEKSKIEGSDFLTILYEINEVDTIVENMGEMMGKIASVYNKFSAEEQTDANYDMIDSLKRGLVKMSEENGKAVKFEFINEKNLSIPKSDQNPIKDIVIQLMRNSIAHGIEAPNIRIAKRKLIKGNVSLTLDKEEETGHLILKYKDDGSGLNAVQIVEKAIDKDLLPASRRDNISDEEIVKLLISEGFSTSEEVDEFSGRGHGFSVVQSKVNELGGTFVINFEKGQFFKMTIRIPADHTLTTKEG